MNGEARDTKEASPTPTNMRQTTRLQKPMAAPEPATASVQMPSPTPMSRKPAGQSSAGEEFSTVQDT